jgi:hypothetical protein
MVAASVRIENGFGTIYAEFTRKVRSDPDPNSPLSVRREALIMIVLILSTPGFTQNIGR